MSDNALQLHGEFLAGYRAETARINDWYHCDHSDVERQSVRRRTYSNGQKALWLQCDVCGSGLRAVSGKAYSAATVATLPPFDDSLSEERSRERRRRIEEAAQRWFSRQAEEQAAAGHKEWYHDYLRSPEWRARREAVLQRDKGLCQGCRSSSATQVHHLTYAHVGAEFLFELVALCRPCHERYHQGEYHDPLAQAVFRAMQSLHVA